MFQPRVRVVASALNNAGAASHKAFSDHEIVPENIGVYADLTRCFGDVARRVLVSGEFVVRQRTIGET